MVFLSSFLEIGPLLTPSVYAGIAASASMFLNQIEVKQVNGIATTPNPAFGSIFQIGWAFALGIAFAIITCASTSGGYVV